MTTQNKNGQEKEKITALYCRLSVDDDKKDMESNSITNQKQILLDYAKKHGYLHPFFFVDDGISGTTFQRPDFQRMQRMAENGEVGTIIVKDVSRFGREQVEMGRLTQVVYPSLGITFIAIQENINSTTGEGMEMLPFYSIFNEWYAAQTSKKIRAVNELKASQGRRVASAVAYGYKKIEGDKEQWYIDELAAQVVRKIFALCLAGKGPTQIARQLEKEKVLTPTAYFHSIGRKTSNPVPANIYGWHESTVEHILENQQYTGCTVNGKSSTVSYKVHKVIENPKEEYQIIPNTQEAIIDENVWLRVQELRKNKRRPTKTNRKSLFSGLVFCADCKSRLHFCAAKSLKRNQEFFRCANYKDGRGSCTIHFIRDVVLEMIVKEAVAGLADFVRCYESVFLYMQKQKCGEFQKKRQQELKLSMEGNRKRIADLDKLFNRIYEDNVIGKLSDERYARMAVEYEAEQKELLEKVREEEKQLSEMEQKSVDMRLLLQGLREFTDMKELTPTIVNKLIRRIEVHNPEKKYAHKSVKVDIYFTAVGLVSLPDEQEIRKMMEQMRSTSQLPKQLTA
ncbi:hypothetical protein B5E64_05755 [Drancourtella sp. An12]|uniref:recombinase family protein n=1 Tax=Drancourtella sp. An12 TaxID=1965548 RepID=UPI000B36EE35|nr:recombinase family protein [Drancourtella sp. An12]OUQ46263.1 hypothetical protein B5E64_05755 [Drancourtella sp. An12]